MSAEERLEQFRSARLVSPEFYAETKARLAERDRIRREMAHDEWAETEGLAATEVDDPWFSWTAGPY